MSFAEVIESDVEINQVLWKLERHNSLKIAIWRLNNQLSEICGWLLTPTLLLRSLVATSPFSFALTTDKKGFVFTKDERCHSEMRPTHAHQKCRCTFGWQFGSPYQTCQSLLGRANSAPYPGYSSRRSLALLSQKSVPVTASKGPLWGPSNGCISEEKHGGHTVTFWIYFRALGHIVQRWKDQKTTFHRLFLTSPVLMFTQVSERLSINLFRRTNFASVWKQNMYRMMHEDA